MVAVFLSLSQWMLPRVSGFNSTARDTTTEIFQPCRFSRFCHAQTRADANLSAISERSYARVSLGVCVEWATEGHPPRTADRAAAVSLGVSVDWAIEGTPPPNTQTSSASELERHLGWHPTMCSIIPSHRQVQNLQVEPIPSRPTRRKGMWYYSLERIFIHAEGWNCRVSRLQRRGVD